MDFEINGSGSVYIVIPCTDAAKEWASENVDTSLTFGEGFACESRHIETMAIGMLNYGFVVHVNGNDTFIGDDGTVVHH